MKTSKRIWLGLGAFFILLALCLSLFPTGRALAAGASSPQDVLNCDKNLKFVSIAEIDCKFTPAGQSSTTTVRFVDVNPSDSGNCDSSCAFKMNYAQQDSFFCENGGVSPSSKSKLRRTQYYDIGITIQQNKGDIGGGPLKVSDAGKNVKLVFNEGYGNSSTGQCGYPKGYNKDNLPNVTINGSDTAGIANVMQFSTDGSSIGPLDNVTGGDVNKSYDLVGKYKSGSTIAYTNDFTPGTCSGDIIMVNTGNKSASRFTLTNGKKSLSSYPSLLDFLNKQSTHGCYINEGDTDFGLGGSFKLIGTPPTAATISGAQPAGAGTTQGLDDASSSSDCESNSGGFSMAWAVCPVLDAASGLANEFIGLFEDQLSFRVSDLGSTTNAASGYNQTKAGWAVIRDVASSLIVIFMLVMVLSQAISWGPFDAYTVKKLLPKLVVAIIVMQVSWNLFVWVVDLFDDLGHGIANLMYLPFGGPSNMDLWHLLGNANIGFWTLLGINYSALIVGFLAVKLAVLPAFAGIIFGALLALAFGLFTLVFRKILIIMLLMLAPLALVAWILPGTQTYWKMWRENFIKALSMFPIAMAIIAAGRIFAKVAGAQDGNGTFLNMIFVFVGFFGPLFILPKTFKWGGQAMQMAGNGVVKTKELAKKYPDKYFQARQENWNKRNKARSYERVRNNEKFKWNQPSSYWTTPLDRFASGKWDPLLGTADWMPGVKEDSSMRRSKVQQYKEAGHKVQEEEQNLADREANDDERRLDQQGFEEGGYNHDDLWQDKLNGNLENYKTKYEARDFAAWQKKHPGGTLAQFQNDEEAYGYKDYGRNVIPVGEPRDHYEENAARNMLAKFGGPNHPTLLKHLWQEKFSGNPERVKNVMEWAQDHSEFILKVYPQFLKGVSSTAGNPSLAGMHPIGFRDELGRLSVGSDPTQTRKFISTLISNMRSPTRDGIETDIRVLMKAIASGDDDYVKKVNEDIEKMKYEDGIIDRDSGVNNPPKIDVDAVRRAMSGTGEEDLTAQINAMIGGDEKNRTGAYTRAATEGGGGGTSSGSSSSTDEPSAADEPPETDRGYRPRQQTSSYMEVPEGQPVRTHSPVARATEPREFEETQYGADRASGSSQAGTDNDEQPRAEAPGSSYNDHGSFAPSVSNEAPRSTERITREIRTAPATQTTVGRVSPTNLNAPVVNVNIDHDALGQAFASSMRNVLQHTTLKIEHPDGAQGAGKFEPKRADEEGGEWNNLRPPTPPAG